MKNDTRASNCIDKQTCLTQMLLVIIWSLLSCVGRNNIKEKKNLVETKTDECLNKRKIAFTLIKRLLVYQNYS